MFPVTHLQIGFVEYESYKKYFISQSIFLFSTVIKKKVAYASKNQLFITFSRPFIVFLSNLWPYIVLECVNSFEMPYRCTLIPSIHLMEYLKKKLASQPIVSQNKKMFKHHYLIGQQQNMYASYAWNPEWTVLNKT